MPHAHVTTSTTHKTLAGPRGGIILSNDAAIAKKINSAVFPGQQGGPLEHVIAGKAVAFKIAASARVPGTPGTRPGWRPDPCRTPGPAGRHGKGITLVSGGTDVHLVLVDLRNCELDGQQAEDRLAAIDITVNRNAVPFDPRPPMVTSGLRIGTPALATRGFGEAAFREVADIIAEALIADADADLSGLRHRVQRPSPQPTALPAAVCERSARQSGRFRDARRCCDRDVMLGYLSRHRIGSARFG